MPPRTVAEFSAHGLRAWLSCGSCGGVQVAPLDVLDATFGPDFDLVGNHREVNRQLYCPACGESRPTVLLEKPATGEQGAEPARWYG